VRVNVGKGIWAEEWEVKREAGRKSEVGDQSSVGLRKAEVGARLMHWALVERVEC
jgi:hypothetical protein